MPTNDLSNFWNDPAELKKLMLMAAFYEGARPGSRYHKCDKVISKALIWLNLWNHKTHDDLRGDCENVDIDRCYRAIIELIHSESQENVLLEGRGNFRWPDGIAARPPYTECRLTHLGAEKAETMLKELWGDEYG